MIVRWPGTVPAGTESAQLTSLTDVMATVASIVGEELPDDAGEDSFDMLPAWTGAVTDEPIRPYLLAQGFGGSKYLAIRAGRWKYLAHKGSGGNRYETHAMLKEYLLPDTAPDAPGQLFDLQVDPGETQNVYHDNPETVAKLTGLLEQSIAEGRSAPLKAAR